MQKKMFFILQTSINEIKKNNIDGIHAFYENIAILATMDLME